MLVPSVRQEDPPRSSMLQSYLLAHAQHAVDLGDSEPVQDIWHQGLEPHVLDAGDVFGPFEVVRCTVFSTFPRVVHHCEMLGAVGITVI